MLFECLANAFSHLGSNMLVFRGAFWVVADTMRSLLRSMITRSFPVLYNGESLAGDKTVKVSDCQSPTCFLHSFTSLRRIILAACRA